MSVATFRRYHEQRRLQLVEANAVASAPTNAASIEEVLAENRSLRDLLAEMQQRLNVAERIADEKFLDERNALQAQVDALTRQCSILRSRLPGVRPSQALQALVGDSVDVRDLPPETTGVREAPESAPAARAPQARSKAKQTG